MVRYGQNEQSQKHEKHHQHHTLPQVVSRSQSRIEVTVPVEVTPLRRTLTFPSASVPYAGQGTRDSWCGEGWNKAIYILFRSRPR